MRMTALVVAEGIRVVAAECFENLFPILQMHFGDTAGPRFSVRDHGLAIRVQVVMTIGPARGGMIRFGEIRAIGRAPATKALRVIGPRAAMKADAFAIAAPKFVLVPLMRALAWDRGTFPASKI